MAARRGAPEAAAELFSAAKRLTPPVREEELTSRGLGEAKALLAAGDVDGARKIASEAARASAAGLRAEQNSSSVTSTGSAAPGRARSSTWRTPLRRPEDPALAARAYPKLVNYTTHAPPKRSSARSGPSQP